MTSSSISARTNVPNLSRNLKPSMKKGPKWMCQIVICKNPVTRFNNIYEQIRSTATAGRTGTWTKHKKMFPQTRWYAAFHLFSGFWDPCGHEVHALQSGGGYFSERLIRTVCCFCSLSGTWRRASITRISQSRGRKNENQSSSVRQMPLLVSLERKILTALGHVLSKIQKEITTRHHV